VQVPCGEGIAIHIGPEPCAGVREEAGEASVGESIGQAIEPRKPYHPGCRHSFGMWKATWTGAISRAPGRSGVVTDPGMCRRFLHGNREISGLTARQSPPVRIGKARSRSR